LEVAPAIKHSDGFEIALQARVEHVEYAGTYESVQNVSYRLGRHRVDVRTTLAATLSYQM
jgi:hypothetical protein